MAKLHHLIEIDASVERAWEVLADLEAVKYYNPLVADARYISSNKEGIGAARHCDLKPSGFTRERATGWEPKESLTIELVESAWPVKYMRWTTYLKAKGDGTVISQDMEYEVKFGLIGKLLDMLMMKSKLERAVSDVFDNLKRFVEGGIKQPSESS